MVCGDQPIVAQLDRVASAIHEAAESKGDEPADKKEHRADEDLQDVHAAASARQALIQPTAYQRHEQRGPGEKQRDKDDRPRRDTQTPDVSLGQLVPFATRRRDDLNFRGHSVWHDANCIGK